MVRILNNEDIPFSFSYDLKPQKKAKKYERSFARYEPPITSTYELRELSQQGAGMSQAEWAKLTENVRVGVERRDAVSFDRRPEGFKN